MERNGKKAAKSVVIGVKFSISILPISFSHPHTHASMHSLSSFVWQYSFFPFLYYKHWAAMRQMRLEGGFQVWSNVEHEEELYIYNWRTGKLTGWWMDPKKKSICKVIICYAHFHLLFLIYSLFHHSLSCVPHCAPYSRAVHTNLWMVATRFGLGASFGCCMKVCLMTVSENRLMDVKGFKAKWAKNKQNEKVKLNWVSSCV